MRKLGFTNKLAVCLVGVLVMGLMMAFILALLSIRTQYMGTLACFTVVFTPLGTGIDIVLHAIVNKSKAENINGDGTGIRYKQIVSELKKEEATI